jgi:hypothetical protein
MPAERNESAMMNLLEDCAAGRLTGPAGEPGVGTGYDVAVNRPAEP